MSQSNCQTELVEVGFDRLNLTLSWTNPFFFEETRLIFIILSHQLIRTPMQNDSYHLGLLHFVHLLVTVDGHIDDRERVAILAIKKEENISDKVFHEFEKKAETTNEPEVYRDGINYLSACTDEEKLAAFVHLYKLAEADSSISNKEVRFLLYGLKATKISFEDVVMTAGMSGK